MDYFWQSELAYSLDKGALKRDGAPFIRRKAFIDGKVVPYDRMDSDFRLGQKFYEQGYPDLKFLGTGEIYELKGVKQGRFRNMSEKYCVTIEDVYGVPFAALSAPQGYEFTGEFRPAKDMETVLAVGANIASTIYTTKETKQYPRLILRAIPTVESVYEGQTLEQLREKAKTAKWWDDENLKFEWTGEFRKVKEGDYFLSAATGDGVILNGEDNEYCFTGVYRLIMRKCPTIKEIYGKELSELTPPKGYEFGEFRRVQTGEDWMDSCGTRISNHVKVAPPGGAYRLILKKKVPTIKDIYGAPLDKLTPPIGYRFTGEFRVPLHMEPCMHPRVHTEIVRYPNLAGDPQAKPRLILEKLPANPTIKHVYLTDTPVLPKGWRMKEFRQIKAGEDIHYLGFCGFGSVTDRPLHAREQVFVADSWKDGWRIVLEKELDLSTLTCTETVTVEDVYGYLPKIPSGYKVIDFRLPKTGEMFLNSWREVDLAKCDWTGEYRPCLILSPLGPR